MPEWRTLLAIGCIGATSYAMRAGGFLLAGALPTSGPVQRFLRLLPANLFVAFVAAGCLGGAPNIAGAVAALLLMAVTGRTWAALSAGFIVSAVVATVTR